MEQEQVMQHQNFKATLNRYSEGLDVFVPGSVLDFETGVYLDLTQQILLLLAYTGYYRSNKWLTLLQERQRLTKLLLLMK